MKPCRFRRRGALPHCHTVYNRLAKHGLTHRSHPTLPLTPTPLTTTPPYLDHSSQSSCALLARLKLESWPLEIVLPTLYLQ